jgi:hypothetical protein
MKTNLQEEKKHKDKNKKREEQFKQHNNMSSSIHVFQFDHGEAWF